MVVNGFDVSIYAIRRRRDRRRQFEVRWRAAGRSRSRSFITRGLADSYRAELVRAARQGREFDPATGEPVSLAAPAPAMTWLEHATAYAAMKWPDLAPHSRASIADALATITPALTRPATRQPPQQLRRAALYQHAFNPARTTPPTPDLARALAWLHRASLPLACLSDPAVVRQALHALTLRQDGTRAAATTIARKRAVLHNALAYATETGLLPANPLDRITWKNPAASTAIDPRTVPSPRQVQAILDRVAQLRPELTAFFGCLYYAASDPKKPPPSPAPTATSPGAAGEPSPSLPPAPAPPPPGPAPAPPTRTAASSTAPNTTSARYPSPRSWSPSCAATWTTTAPPPTGGYSAAPEAASSAKASTAAPGTQPAARPLAMTSPPRASPADPTTCATPP